MTLSIIIPVYNSQPFLTDCLDSILRCNLSDCEVILSVRDSQDDSNRICMDYEARYNCIRLETQHGTGLSNARNTVMRTAGGKYVLFVDSDDYVNSEVLGDLINKLRDGSLGGDVIVTDYFFVEHPAKKVVPVFQIGERLSPQYGMKFLPTMLRKRKCFWNVWRYIYRRSFLLEHDIFFRENTLSEDVDFTTRVLLAEPEIIFIHSPYYFYNVGRGRSLMDICSLERLRDTVQVLSDSIRYTRREKAPYAGLLGARFQFEYILNIAMIVEVDKSDRDAALSLFADADEVLGDSEDMLVSAVRTILRILGTKSCAWLLHYAKQIRRQLLGRNKRQEVS